MIMKQVYLFLAEGFEEIEAISVIDMLRRADINVTTISITDQKKVTGAHHITIEADGLFTNTDFSNGKMLILPGGMPGTNNLLSFLPLKELIQKYNTNKQYIAAI
ncbi:MAG: DJ-1/PfpI family protein, partial [Bacteroidales bacterium]